MPTLTIELPYPSSRTALCCKNVENALHVFAPSCARWNMTSMLSKSVGNSSESSNGEDEDGEDVDDAEDAVEDTKKEEGDDDDIVEASIPTEAPVGGAG